MFSIKLIASDSFGLEIMSTVVVVGVSVMDVDGVDIGCVEGNTDEIVDVSKAVISGVIVGIENDWSISESGGGEIGLPIGGLED